MNPTLLLLLVVALGWVAFFVWRSRMGGGAGLAGYARAQLNQRFGLSADEQVSAAFSADSVPQLSTGQKVADAVGAVASVAGLGFTYVGRPLGVACTTKNRVLVLDREDGSLLAFGPSERPRISDTGKPGKARPSQVRVGFDKGAILKLEATGQPPLEIDLPAEALQLLVAWSQGSDVSHLAGPYPARGAI
jgi:hypothetical protein